RPRSSVWVLKAHIGEACLAKQQVICTTCSEQCEAGAIRFERLIGSVAQPEINLHACTGARHGYV
ncbi:MAG: hypothetical protein Q9M16_04305, partial [Mariprofundus sp.]|nr:hypothetical protein [Mariprofundus sp.]